LLQRYEKTDAKQKEKFFFLVKNLFFIEMREKQERGFHYKQILSFGY